MADYPLKQLAEDVQKILDTALTVNNSYPQTLTEEEKAITREKIGASAIGEGIKIISHFDTLEELVSTITKPSAGDAYSVGTEIPYRLYVYDFLREEWRDYGPIRSTDIKARFAQNVAVSTSAWEADTDVFEDYTYKAQIPLGEVTGNDFPIVAFAPFDAVSGNYCPIAYCFDGYVEVWAKAIPATAITIPAITFIIQDDGASGGSTKGITNASGGIATGGITGEMLAPKSVTRAKLANDALYSPVVNITSSTTASANHIGKHLLCNSGSSPLEFLIDQAANSSLPVGADFAVIRWMTGKFTVKFSGNLVVVHELEGMLKTASKESITLTFSIYGTLAIKKVSSTGYIIYGIPEVVS